MGKIVAGHVAVEVREDLFDSLLLFPRDPLHDTVDIADPVLTLKR